MRWVKLSACVVLALLLGAGLLLSPADEPDLSHRLQPPSVQHPMGCDELGRDVLNRTLRATSLSLALSTLAWSGALILGLTLGTLAGYHEASLVDKAIRGLVSLIYATPFLITLIGILSVLGPGLLNAYIVLLLLLWAAPARQTRTIVRHAKGQPHVMAARSFGFAPSQIFRFSLLPAVYRPVLIASLGLIPEIMALDAALSFFGLGAHPPTPTIGRMILNGIDYMTVAWWTSFFPLAALVGTCFAIRCLLQHKST